VTSSASSNVTVPIVTAVSSGGFALLGVGVSSWWSGRREKARFRTESVLELAGMERLIWGEDWIELQAHLQRQQARLAIGGVPEDLIQSFRTISIACWRDLQANIVGSGGQEPGIDTKLLGVREAVHCAIRMYLLREGHRSGRRESRSAALARVRIVQQRAWLSDA
jgi:hypothetical protein